MAHDNLDMLLEVARLQREALTAVHAKHAAQQLGEDFVGLDDRRIEGSMRGEDRRG